MRKNHRRNLRQRKFVEQNGLCHICSEPMLLDDDKEGPLFATFDHIIPVAEGGPQSTVSNVKLAHKRCNNKRGREDVLRRRVPYSGPHSARVLKEDEPAQR